MTNDDIAADRAIIESATPGPWEVTPEPDMPTGIGVRGNSLLMLDRDGMACVERRQDATFIAAARTRWPAALDELERWRNCFICTSCGRCSVDEDGCCVTCGADCIAFEDGKLARPLEETTDLIGVQHENFRLRAALAEMTAARDEACDLAAELMTEYEAAGSPCEAKDRGHIAQLRAVGGDDVGVGGDDVGEERFFIDHGTVHDRVTGKHVFRLLDVVSDYEQTAEEAEAELRDDGVDVEAFLARVREAVEKAKAKP